MEVVRLSVVVPLFNCLPLTQAMVASLQSSLPPDTTHEIILVDDGSTDGTREWLASLGKPFRVVLNERNLGYGASTNRGAAIAIGRYFALLNNDLVLSPGWLEPMLEVIRRLDDKAGVVGSVQVDARTGAVDHSGIFINHKGKPEHDRRRPCQYRLSGFRFQSHRPVPAVTGACLVLRRDLWQELKGFDEGYVNGCEDVDLCFRAAALGYVNAVAVRSIVRHHISASQGRKARDEANTWRLARRWRTTLAPLGRRDWCRNYLETHLPEPRDFPDQALARQCALYLLGFRSDPPTGALPGMLAAIDAEMERWQGMGFS